MFILGGLGGQDVSGTMIDLSLSKHIQVEHTEFTDGKTNLLL